MAKRPSAGRPPFDPTDEQRNLAKVLVANGIAQRIIASIVGCDVKTLRKHLKTELLIGAADVEARMGAAVVRSGLQGNVNAQKYWLSTHGSPEWRIVEGRELSGRVEIQDAPIEDLERELATLRSRAAITDRTRDVAAEMPDLADGVLH